MAALRDLPLVNRERRLAELISNQAAIGTVSSCISQKLESAQYAPRSA
jgi:hypothetical protein